MGYISSAVASSNSNALCYHNVFRCLLYPMFIDTTSVYSVGRLTSDVALLRLQNLYEAKAAAVVVAVVVLTSVQPNGTRSI